MGMDKSGNWGNNIGRTYARVSHAISPFCMVRQSVTTHYTMCGCSLVNSNVVAASIQGLAHEEFNLTFSQVLLVTKVDGSRIEVSL